MTPRRSQHTISEIVLATHPQAPSLPPKKPVIPRIACGVVVMKSGAISGSLITNNMVLNLGHVVGVISDELSNPRSYGSNPLIRSGAILT
jgi:predicted Rossmann fold nucleotide-binding protein DprA/Smf involved in DNA uptake